MERLRGLDGLRGVAAMLVFAQHFLFILSARDYAWAGTIISTVDLGKLGVALFFLISGFVIPFSLSRGLAAFWIGRAFRLLPALWLSIALCIALGATVNGSAHLLANALMIGIPMKQPMISSPYWTLGLELYFYGAVALAFACGWIRKPATFGLAAVILALATAYRPWLAYMIFMFAGALLRMVLVDQCERAKVWLAVAIGALFGALFIWFLRGTMTAGFFLTLVLALPAFTLFWNGFTHPALIWLGNISYSLYLFHLPILEALDGLGISTPAFAAMGTALPLLVAAAVHRWVEIPAMALGKALSSRIVSKRHLVALHLEASRRSFQ